MLIVRNLQLRRTCKLTPLSTCRFCGSVRPKDSVASFTLMLKTGWPLSWEARGSCGVRLACCLDAGARSVRATCCIRAAAVHGAMREVGCGKLRPLVEHAVGSQRAAAQLGSGCHMA